MNAADIAATLKARRAQRRADLIAADLPTSTRHHLDAEIDDLQERLAAAPAEETPATATHRRHHTSARGLAKGDRILGGISKPIGEGFGTVRALHSSGSRFIMALIEAEDGSEGWVDFERSQTLDIETPTTR